MSCDIIALASAAVLFSTKRRLEILLKQIKKSKLVNFI